MHTPTVGRFEKKIDRLPFTIGFTAIFAFFVCALFFPETLKPLMKGIQNILTKDMGWSFVFVSFMLVLLTFAIIVSPIGSIRIGGKDAKPDFGIIKWFSISLCSGIGIGILFWGIGEPIYHLMQPPVSIDVRPGSHDAALFAISQSILHWSIAQYCIYALCGTIFALMAFNLKYPLSIMSGLAPIVPEKYHEPVKNIVHAACLFSICCAVISSCGALIMLISSCFSYLFHIEKSFLLSAAVTLFSTLFFVISSTTGLKKGMSFLSKMNTRAFFIILFFVFFCGPTLVILNMGTECFGYMLTHFFRHSTLVSSQILNDHWADTWLIVYMAFFFGYGPPIGLYLARLGKGRTVREFLLMNVLAPSCFVYFWINTFGSLAIYDQLTGTIDVWNFVQSKGLESTVIAILQTMPLHNILIAVFMTVTVVSFVTLVDPMTCVLATLSIRGISAEDEAPSSLKVTWGGTMGLVPLALVALTGITALRGMAILSGVLMMLLTLALCLSLVKVGRRICQSEGYGR